jgi:hypothetical protein
VGRLGRIPPQAIMSTTSQPRSSAGDVYADGLESYGTGFHGPAVPHVDTPGGLYRASLRADLWTLRVTRSPARYHRLFWYGASAPLRITPYVCARHPWVHCALGIDTSTALIIDPRSDTVDSAPADWLPRGASLSGLGITNTDQF